MKLLFTLVFCAALAAQTFGATIYLTPGHPSASDANPGTSASAPKATPAGAQTGRVAGDVIVWDFTYATPIEGTVTISVSGNSSAPIYWVGIGSPVSRRVLLTANYVVFAHMKIEQTDNTTGWIGLDISGDYNQVFDCDIGPTDNLGIRFGTTANGNRVTYNRITRAQGIVGDQRGEVPVQMNANNNLFEYNFVDKSGDFFVANSSSRSIVRNNSWGPSSLLDTPDYPDPEGHHLDYFQWSPVNTMENFFYENNYGINNLVPHGHGILIQNNHSTGYYQARYVVVRGSLFAQMSGGAIGFNPFRDAYVYHNSVIEVAQFGAGNNPVGATTRANNDDLAYIACENIHIFNNIIQGGGGTFPYYYQTASGSIPDSSGGRYADYNSWFDTGSPQVAEANGHAADAVLAGGGSAAPYYLSGSSPVLANAGPVTTATTSGSSSTSLTVANSKRFHDGLDGLAEGDWIVIGSGAPVQITAINYATDGVTLSAARTWSLGDPVYWATPNGAAIRHRGAFSAQSHTITPTLTESPSGTWTVTTTGAPVRKVIICVDYVPRAEIYAPGPYTLSGVGPGARVDAYVLPWYPDPTTAYVVDNVGGGEPSTPAPTTYSGARIGGARLTN